MALVQLLVSGFLLVAALIVLAALRSTVLSGHIVMWAKGCRGKPTEYELRWREWTLAWAEIYEKLALVGGTSLALVLTITILVTWKGPGYELVAALLFSAALLLILRLVRDALELSTTPRP